ncbi:MAG TPA: ABC transporter, partial [Leeuwenhoekiella sp.]|nr:ABC transporter [Leeuwenhoekiella sp.]
ALSYNEQKEYNRLERDIAKLEKEKEKKEAEFLNPDLSGDEINQASVELQQIQDKIDEFTERWFDLSAKMEG